MHVLVPDIPQDLSVSAARLQWKASLTIAVYSDAPPEPPTEWDDAAIPAKFWVGEPVAQTHEQLSSAAAAAPAAAGLVGGISDRRAMV